MAIVGVALGVNVMIVVIAFMQGFQEKFKSDIIDAQGHARMIPVNPQGRSMDVLSSLDEQDEIIKTKNLDYSTENVNGIIEKYSKFYSATDEKHNNDDFNYGVRYYRGRGIKVWDTLRDFKIDE